MLKPNATMVHLTAVHLQLPDLLGSLPEGRVALAGHEADIPRGRAKHALAKRGEQIHKMQAVLR